jgi:hypothetical protein
MVGQGFGRDLARHFYVIRHFVPSHIVVINNFSESGHVRPALQESCKVVVAGKFRDLHTALQIKRSGMCLPIGHLVPDVLHRKVKDRVPHGLVRVQTHTSFT